MQLRFVKAATLLMLAAASCNTDREPDEGPCPNGICVVDAGTQTCAEGDPCDDGNACTVQDACDASGACVGTPLTCNTPPAPSCSDADTSVVYNPQGVCQAGACTYTQNTVTCPGACDTGSGVCPNACEMVTCDQPPSSCFMIPGTCTDGACTYAPGTAGASCDDGDACTIDGACQMDGSCLETPVVCDAPPPAECVGAVLRTYSTNGAACTAGTCNYPSSDQTCAQGCSNGACIGACDEATCDPWVLPSQPNGTAQRTCGDATCPTTLTLPALDENYFRCNVQPTLNTTCAQIGCHSSRTPQRRLRIYARMFGRSGSRVEGAHVDGPIDTMTCGLANCDVDPLSMFERRWNFDSARLFAAEAPTPAASELVTQPLAASAGGLPHDGFDMFQSTQDARYQAIQSWLSGATETANCGGRTLPVTNAGFVNELDEYTPAQCVR